MKLRSLLVVVALGAGSLVVATSPAHASGGQLLPFSYLSDTLVDDADGRVLFSGDGHLYSTDLDGHVTTNPSVDIKRLAWSPDGSAIVVTRGDTEIGVMDPTTRVVTKSVYVDVGCQVGDIAPASGKMFFTYFCPGSPGKWRLGAVDLSTNTFTYALDASFPEFGSALVSVPGAPSTLVAWDGGRVVVYDTTGGASPTATVRTSRYLQAYDLALAPDGSQIVVSGQPQSSAGAYETTDLAQVGEYYTRIGGPVAVRGDGAVATAQAGQDVRFFKSGSFEPDQVRPLSYGNYFNAGSLTFGAKRLYEVRNISAHLELFVDTPGPPAALTIHPVASTYGYGASPSVKVTIVSPTTQRTLNLYATPASGGSKKLVKTVDTGPGGSITTALPAAYINTTYTAEFTGDGDFSASTATTSVKVRPQITLSTASTSKSGYFHKLPAVPPPSLLVKVLPTPVSGCLTLTYQRYTSSGWVANGHASCVTRTSGNSYKSRVAGSHGQKIRVMATLTRSAYNADASSSWYYILLT